MIAIDTRGWIRAIVAAAALAAMAVAAVTPGALALGDDKTAYGWGYAGNRADAEKHALEDCKKRTTNVKIVVSFCTNGVEQ